MEFLKNFFVGLGVLILTLILLGFALLLLPLLLITAPLLFFLLKGVIFVIILLGFITLIGYTVRKITK